MDQIIHQNQKYSIYSKKGQEIITNYIQHYIQQGGGWTDEISSLLEQKNEIQMKIEQIKQQYGYWSKPIKGSIIES